MTDAGTTFTQEQYDRPYPNGIERHYWAQARHRILLRQIEQQLGSQRDATVLDIGCGRGITVDYLRSQGIQAQGCELGRPSPISAAVAPYLHIGVDAFTLDEGLRQSVKVILLLDVLEHMEQPREFLAECGRRFPACDRVIITLPARQEIWSNYDEYYGHFLRYDAQSVGRLVPDAWQLTSQSYFFHLLYVPARLMSALGMPRSVDVAAPAPKTRWAHKALGVLFDWEARLCPSFVPGTSILAVLRRKLTT